MGAELILVWAAAPQNLTENSKQQMLSRVESLTKEDLERAVETAHSAEISDIFGDDDPYAQCSEAISDAIEAMWSNNNRYLFHIPGGVLGGSPCWIAGGTSWGDSFDEMDQLMLVNGSGLLDVFQ